MDRNEQLAGKDRHRVTDVGSEALVLAAVRKTHATRRRALGHWSLSPLTATGFKMPVLVIIIMILVFYMNIVIIVRVPGKRFPAWLLDDYSLVKKSIQNWFRIFMTVLEILNSVIITMLRQTCQLLLSKPNHYFHHILKPFLPNCQ